MPTWPTTKWAEQAEEALNDPNRVVFDPDPAQKPGGRAVRTVGYSRSGGAVLCVITVTERGITYGATAFTANTTYQRIYREEGSSGQERARQHRPDS